MGPYGPTLTQQGAQCHVQLALELPMEMPQVVFQDRLLCNLQQPLKLLEPVLNQKCFTVTAVVMLFF